MDCIDSESPGCHETFCRAVMRRRRRPLAVSFVLALVTTSDTARGTAARTDQRSMVPIRRVIPPSCSSGLIRDVRLYCRGGGQHTELHSSDDIYYDDYEEPYDLGSDRSDNHYSYEEEETTIHRPRRRSNEWWYDESADASIVDNDDDQDLVEAVEMLEKGKEEERILAALAEAHEYGDKDSKPLLEEGNNRRSNRQRRRQRQGNIQSRAKSKPSNSSTLLATRQKRRHGAGGKTHASMEYISLPEHFKVSPQTTEARRVGPAPQDATTAEPKQLHAQGTSPVATTTSSISSPWIRQFLASCHRDVLLPVPADYILDNFNLAQLAPVIEKIATCDNKDTPTEDSRDGPIFLEDGVLDAYPIISAKYKNYPIYRQALQLIVQDKPVDSDVAIPKAVDRAARSLYLLIHQRYVLSPRGLDMVRRRFLLPLLSKPTTINGNGNKDIPALQVDPIFGRCPSLNCRGMPLLPYGDSDNVGLFEAASSQDIARVMRHCCKRYCGSCGHVFVHWESKVDGCAWGPSFCHLFLMTCGSEVFEAWISSQDTSERMDVDKLDRETNDKFDAGFSPLEGRIFGFRIDPFANPVAKWHLP